MWKYNTNWRRRAATALMRVEEDIYKPFDAQVNKRVNSEKFKG